MNLRMVTDSSLFLFAEGKEDLFNFVLVKVDMRVDCDVLNDIPLHLKGIKCFSSWFWDQSHYLRLVGTSHRLYKLAKNSYNSNQAVFNHPH